MSDELLSPWDKLYKCDYCDWMTDWPGLHVYLSGIVERGDQEGTVSPNWLSTLELWRHLYTGKEKSFVRKDLPTNFKSHFQGFDCNDEETF